MKNLYGALLKAQQEFPAVPKDGKNPHLNSRYATLGGVQETANPILHKHGLIVLQSVRTEWAERGPIVYVGATLVHVESGESTTQELGLIPVKLDPQGVGSAISYGRRYLLLTMLGLSTDDDDGNAASGQKTQNAQPTPRPAQAAHRPQNGAAQDSRQPGPENDEQFAGPPISEAQMKKVHATLSELYPGKGVADGKRPALVKHFSGGRTESLKELTGREASALIDALVHKLDESKQPA